MTVTLFSNPSASDTPLEEGLPLPIYQEVLHALAKGVPEDRFRSICLTVLRQTLLHLDPQQQGLSLFVLQCTPPATDEAVQSLSLRLDQGIVSRVEEVPSSPLFFGAQSLSAFAMMSGHVAFVHSTLAPQERQLFVNWHHAQCLVASPIKRFGRCAGSLTAFSPFLLQGPDLAVLQDATNLISFAIPEQEYFAGEQFSFQIMPPIQALIDHLSLYRQRFLTVVSEARRNGQVLSVWSYNSSRASWLNWRTNTTPLRRRALMRGRTLAGEAIGVTMGIPLRYEKLQRCTDLCHSPWRQLLLLLRGLQGTLVCFEVLRVVIFEY